jgi:hypothetical protein
MMQLVRRKISGWAFAIVLGTVPAWGQQTGAVVPAPVSARLAAAKRVFVVLPPKGSKNATKEDKDYFQTQVAEAMKMWRLYDLAPNAAGADLVFELSIDPHKHRLLAWDPSPAELRLVVRDPRTQSELRTFTEFVKTPFFPFNYFYNFNQAVADLLDNVRQTAGQPATAAPSSIGEVPKAFIASAGDDDEDFYTSAPGQTYNQSYAAMQSSGRYELVDAPAAADLIFEIRYANPRRTVIWPPLETQHENELFAKTENINEPQIKLVIWNRRTRAVVSVITEFVKQADLESNRRKNFALSIQALVDDAGTRLGQPQAQIQANPPLTAKANDAPVPAQIGAAARVFILNPGEDTTHAKDGAAEVYNEAYAAMKSWGRYELVPDAAHADLIVEPSVAGTLARLTILDPGTQAVLWGLTVDVGTTKLQGQNKTVHKAAVALVNSFHRLDARAAAAAKPASSVPAPAAPPAAR